MPTNVDALPLRLSSSRRAFSSDSTRYGDTTFLSKDLAGISFAVWFEGTNTTLCLISLPQITVSCVFQCHFHCAETCKVKQKSPRHSQSESSPRRTPQKGAGGASEALRGNSTPSPERTQWISDAVVQMRETRRKHSKFFL